MALEPGRVEREDPLAYLLTWTTYGTWLPGDERLWVAKPGEFCPPDGELERIARLRMTEPPLTLDSEQRELVEKTIGKHCKIRKWFLHAVNVRTQHVHVVVTAPGRKPELVMDQFKSWCTRYLKERERSLRPDAATIRENWWTQRGSKRFLNDEQGLEGAILYVRDCQDGTPCETSE